MADVVERAREVCDRIGSSGNWSGFPPALADELVAEIERLRRELRSAQDRPWQNA